MVISLVSPLSFLTSLPLSSFTLHEKNKGRWSYRESAESLDGFGFAVVFLGAQLARLAIKPQHIMKPRTLLLI